MATLWNVAVVVRRVRQRLGLSQEALARLLNATKGAVQHWERGRNRPDLARLLALRQLCRRGPERKQLDALICQTQARVAPLGVGAAVAGTREAGKTPGPAASPDVFARGEVELLRRQHDRLQRQVAKLHHTVQKRDEQLRILQNLAAQLQRELASLRPKPSGFGTPRCRLYAPSGISGRS
jgi:transcriptional regulator with XRE-family HTH domain